MLRSQTGTIGVARSSTKCGRVYATSFFRVRRAACYCTKRKELRCLATLHLTVSLFLIHTKRDFMAPVCPIHSGQ